MTLDLREGLPEEWILVPGMLYMIDTSQQELQNALHGPSYIYEYHECEDCGRRTSVPWPLREGIAVFCRRCGKEFL